MKENASEMIKKQQPKSNTHNSPKQLYRLAWILEGIT